MFVLGLDPARAGGGIMVKGRDVIVAMHWRTHIVAGNSCFMLTVAGGGVPYHIRGLRTPWELGLVIRKRLAPLLGGSPMHIAAEAAHIGRNPRTGLALSRFGGALVAPLEGLDPGCATSWVEPDQWRNGILRKKWWKMQANEQGKQASMTVALRIIREKIASDPWALSMFTENPKWLKDESKRIFLSKREAAKAESALVMPSKFPGLAQLASLCGGEEHVFDAAGIALWKIHGIEAL